MPKTPEPMDPEDIKAALRKVIVSKSPRRRLTQRYIALQLKVDESVVSKVVNGRGASSQVERTIARYIKTPLHKIWPDRYGPDSDGLAA